MQDPVDLRAHYRMVFLKGEIIFRQGEVARYWYELTSGSVRLCHYFGDGRRQITHFPVAGEVFGFERGLRRVSAEALADLTLVRHDIQEASEGGMLPSHGMQCALEAADRNLSLFSHSDACHRLAAFLLDFRHRTQSDERVKLPMCRQDLADHLGLTMYTVSRSMSQLVKRGLLVADNPVELRIVDRQALEAFVGVDWVEPELTAQLIA